MPSSPSSKTPKPDAAPKADGGTERLSTLKIIIIVTLRTLTGAFFVLSGWAKCIDPWGTIFKIEEYLAVWGWYDFPGSLITVGAFALGMYEFVCGALLLLGCYRRGSVVALSLLMLFMLPLSVYIAVANPVADCGCFGDMLVISNGATLVKNILICAALVYLLMTNTRVTNYVTSYGQWIVGGVLTLYVLLLSLVGYNIQPLEDFRRFAPGTPLTADDESSDAGSRLLFTYERDGERRDFSLDELPDSTWTFVDRVEKDAPEMEADGFVVVDPETGEDLTEEVVETPGGDDLFLVTAPEIRDVDLSATYLLNDLNDFVKAREGRLVMLTGVGASAADIDAWRDVSMASYPIYRTDTKMLKELARGTSALVYVRNDTVQWKRTLNSISYSQVTETSGDALLTTLDPQPDRLLYYLTLGFVAIVGAIILLDRTGHLVHIHFRRKNNSNG